MFLADRQAIRLRRLYWYDFEVVPFPNRRSFCAGRITVESCAVATCRREIVLDAVRSCEKGGVTSMGSATEV